MTDTDILLIGLNYAPEHTGVAPYTTGIARGLARAGNRVNVITGYPYYPEWRLHEGYRGLRGGLASRQSDGDVGVLRLRHYVPRSSTGWGRIVHEASFAAHAALRSLGSRKPDVVIGVSPSLLSCLAARQVARRTGAAFGLIVQDIYADTSAEVGAAGGGSVAKLESALLRSADGVVAVHDHFRRSLTTRHGLDPERITVIRNWTHIATPTADPRVVRAELRWPSDRTLVLHAGNMGAKQDLTAVVDAARLAAARSRPVHFVLLGDGSRRAEVQRAAEGVPAVSVLAPVCEERFPDVLAAADVLLVNERPGLHSMSAPSKLTSYFAAGRPVVAASEPASPASEEIRASGAGIVVAPGDPSALLDAVSGLVDDREQSRQLGENGRRYAGTVLNHESAIAAYTQWIRELGTRRAQ